MSPALLNFAYGSNLLLARMRERVPSARPLGVAVLAGHELRWHKVSRDGSGKCDVVAVPRAAAEVQGVVYEIAAAEQAALDGAEGLGSGYERVTLAVRLGSDRVACLLYRATAVDPLLQPYGWYKALVLAGARQHGLTPAYLERLAAVPAIDDPDAGRHSRNMALIGPNFTPTSCT